MALSIRMPSRDELNAELARRSLAFFFRQSWHVLEPATPLIWNWHLQTICDHVQALVACTFPDDVVARLGLRRSPARNLNINVPPGSSKSRIVSVCVTPWVWINFPAFRSINTSANPRNVIRDSVYARQIIDSRWYQESFRPEWRWAADQNAKGLYRNTASGFRQAIGSGGAVTGDRANALFMDDMLDAAKGESQSDREAFKVFYDNAFANRVSDMTRTVRCHIAQRLHEEDPTGHLMKSGDWDSLVIRQEYEIEYENPNDTSSPVKPPKPTSLGWVDPRTKDGELMDPIRFPRAELAKEYLRLGPRGRAAQHQQRPAPAAGVILQRDWFRWYKTPRDEKGNFRPPHEIVKALGITRVIQAADTALGEKQQNDYTADICGGETQNRIYILDLLKEKMSAPVGKAAITAFQAKWNAHAVIIEGGSSASGKAAAQSIKFETRLPVIEMPVQGDKVTAMNAVAPTVAANVVYLPEDQPWALELVESLIRFPVGSHDDDCDAFRILIWYMQFGGGGMGMLEHIRRMAAAKATADAEAQARKNGVKAPTG
jgi:predicted phage terminase large subunit-like protein